MKATISLGLFLTLSMLAVGISWSRWDGSSEERTNLLSEIAKLQLEAAKLDLESAAIEQAAGLLNWELRQLKKRLGKTPQVVEWDPQTTKELRKWNEQMRQLADSLEREGKWRRRSKLVLKSKDSFS